MTGQCACLQNVIRDYLRIQREEGKYISEHLRTQRGYKNPDFLQKMVEYLGVDEVGSNYPQQVFDPHALPPDDFYDKLAEQWQAEQVCPSCTSHARLHTS